MKSGENNLFIKGEFKFLIKISFEKKNLKTSY